MIVLFKISTLFHFKAIRSGWLTLNEILIVSIAKGTQCITLTLLASLSRLHTLPRGDTKHIRIRGGGQSKKFSGNPKISLQHHCNPKISANFILRNLYMNIKLQTKVKIVSTLGTRASKKKEERKIFLSFFSFFWRLWYPG